MVLKKFRFVWLYTTNNYRHFFVFIFKLLLPNALRLFSTLEIFFVNTIGLPFNSGSIIAGLLVIAAFYFGLKYTREKGYKYANTLTLCLIFIFIGFSSFSELKNRVQSIDLNFMKSLMWGVVIFGFLISLVPILWKIQADQFIVWGYQGESFNFLSPTVFNFLFSYEFFFNQNLFRYLRRLFFSFWYTSFFCLNHFVFNFWNYLKFPIWVFPI